MRWGMVGTLAVAMLAFACSGGDDDEDHFETLKDIPTPCRADSPLSRTGDDIALANEILGETEESLLFDAEERDALAAEIRGVLDLVRQELPAAIDIHAPPSDGWLLSLVLTESGAEQVADYSGYGALRHRTDNREIDTLAETLGLLAVRISDYVGQPGAWISLCLGDLANPLPAAAAFEALDSVQAAFEPSRIGGSPAIEMRKRDEKWHVVVRETGGDCATGCLEQALSFFVVNGDMFEAIPEEEAALDALFVHLVDLARWNNDYPWPSPTP